MERLGELAERIRGLSDLLGVVGALRALAAARRQQAVEALSGARAFADMVGDALAAATRLPAEDADWRRPSGPRGVLVFGAEHGFVGAFNGVVLDRARTLAPAGPVFVVGTRCAIKARERGDSPAWTTAMTSHRDGVPAVARRVADVLYRRYAEQSLGGLDIVFAKALGCGRWSVETEPALPLSPQRLAGPVPLTNLAGAPLVEALIGEYVFALVARAALDSLASENAARLAAMEAARENIDRRLQDLRRDEHRLRQEEVTTELLDVVVGAEAVMGDE